MKLVLHNRQHGKFTTNHATFRAKQAIYEVKVGAQTIKKTVLMIFLHIMKEKLGT